MYTEDGSYYFLMQTVVEKITSTKGQIVCIVGFVEVGTHAVLLLWVKPTVALGLFARQPRAKAHAAVWNRCFLANLFSMSPTQLSAFTNLSWQAPRLT